MKSRKPDAELRILEQIKADPLNSESLDKLKPILNSKYAVVVAQASKLIERLEIHDLLPDLVTAFERFLVDPVKTDPSCLAKVAIAETLYRLEHNHADVFLQGIHHYQLEPVYGGYMDTAPKLRVTCALGLVRMHYTHVFVELADLLADPEAPVRMGAAQAVAYTEAADRGLPLLRLRAHTENEPEVIAECLRSLMQLDPAHSLNFVASFLESDQPVTQEYVALILGESRQPEALGILKNWWTTAVDQQLRQIALQAIAMLRSEGAFQFLLTTITEGSDRDAQAVISALSPYSQDLHLWSQVLERGRQRGLLDLHPQSD